MCKLSTSDIKYLTAVLNKCGPMVRRKQFGQPVPRELLKTIVEFKNRYGVYNIGAALASQSTCQPVETTFVEPTAVPVSSAALTGDEILVPEKDKLFVPFGNYDDIMNIVLSKVFYPVYVTGLSGNGKTTMIEQICANAGRNLVRVNITHETDEDMLLGGFRLLNGNTVWFDGPVIKAMKTGSVLLLDEVDLNAIKILCLQPVLEGHGVFLKRTNTYVKPEPGFNVIATANTKGKGSEDGKFIGTTVLNEAFLERFAVTFEQEYPSMGVERKILSTLFNHYKIADNDYCETLVNWADVTRRSYKDGAIDEIISTRRLVHIARAFVIFQDKMKAIELCINRFDSTTKTALLDMYSKFVKPNESEVKFRDSIDSVSDDIANLPELEPIN